AVHAQWAGAEPAWAGGRSQEPRMCSGWGAEPAWAGGGARSRACAVFGGRSQRGRWAEPGPAHARCSGAGPSWTGRSQESRMCSERGAEPT
ncbi:unnamed protein product, partial [Bubo scandiacus]